MKMKRFFASEMREAIRLVKDELGPDAVILSNKKIDGGIELVAAIDYDEDSVQQQLQAQREANKPKASNRGKRSVFSRVRQQSSEKRLEDSIKEDVISFKSAHLPQAEPSGSADERKNQFEALLHKSSQQQAIKNKQQARTAGHNVFSKPSLQERKQPYISDFSDFEEESEADNVDDTPFDYEALLKEQQNTIRQKKHTSARETQDPLFSDKGPHQARSTGKRKSRSAQSGSAVEWIQDPALTSMQEEIKSLRGMLETQLSGLAWGDFSRRHPHRAELLSRLYRLGMKSALSEKLVKKLKNNDSLEESWRQLLTMVARNIPVAKDDLLDDGGIIALVGPTGVGKTTNIAKLAARFTLKYGAKDLALVTTDSYRVGAHEQLKTYGRILGVPVYVANDEDELKHILTRLEDKKLVLIDTAGMSHRDLRLVEQLNMLRRSHHNMKILAVLSAASQTMAIDEVIKTFKAEELDGCIASKVDESTSIGGIISILIENHLQLNYISDGQKVPEDIHNAEVKGLLKQALEMVRQHPVSVKSDELAMSYAAGGLAHAQA
jgi:flagellar biosynthesis protein FlhF